MVHRTFAPSWSEVGRCPHLHWSTSCMRRYSIKCCSQGDILHRNPPISFPYKSHHSTGTAWQLSTLPKYILRLPPRGLVGLLARSVAVCVRSFNLYLAVLDPAAVIPR